MVWAAEPTRETDTVKVVSFARKKKFRPLTADVDSGSDTLEEELSFQEDLTVGNGNNVGGNVGRHVTTLGLNDGEGSEGTSSVVGVHLSGTLEKTRVEVENLEKEENKLPNR